MGQYRLAGLRRALAPLPPYEDILMPEVALTLYCKSPQVSAVHEPIRFALHRAWADLNHAHTQATAVASLTHLPGPKCSR